MEILVYDTESMDEDIYDIVAKHLNINFIKVKTRDNFYSFYENLVPDSLIIIDVTYEVGEELFQYITNNAVKQKILVLSKTLTYNHTFSCEQCAKLFNRKLLLKPINVGQLISYIQIFDKLLCKYSSDSNEITEIMNEILKQFVYYSYKKDEKTIILKRGLSPNTKELIRIIELLNTHNIRYQIKDNNIKLFF